jgi:hypothetical protein
MLDKGQIKDWDGEPEREPAKAPANAIKPPVVETPPAEPPVAEAIVAPPVASSRPDLVAMMGEARQALPTGERVTLTPEQVTARKRRSQWIAIALFAFVIIIFVLTMNKVGSGMALPQVYNMQDAQ